MDDMEGMSMGGMSMGGMSMGAGVPSLFAIQKYYWAAVGSAIALAFVVNLSNIALRRQRLASGSARPRSLLWTVHATLMAVSREITSAPFGSIHVKSFQFPLTTLGRVTLVLSNLITIIVLCFYKLNTADEWSWEDIGYRTGFVAIAQLPLIFLLAGKENIIGLLTGFGYERLNWLHRWVARTLWLTVTIHMGFWFRSWARYDYISSKLTTDPITQRGFAAWCILTFIVATSWMPIRRWNYELFVVTHLVTFSGFIGAVWIHVPDEVKVWVWVPIGLFFFDRLARIRKVIWANFTLLHPLKRKSGDIQQGLWANTATLTPLPGGVTRITISKPAISWEAGQHAFLACHTVVPLQAHPFTIASLPSDKKMEFIVKAEKGGTKRFFTYASKYHVLPSVKSDINKCRKHVSIEGPYGRMRSLDQFDSVVFFAGSTGSTFTVPLMRDIVFKWVHTFDVDIIRQVRPVTRRIRFVWVIKSPDHLEWFRSQLERSVRDVDSLKLSHPGLDVEIDISIYVTCDEELLASRLDLKTARHGAPEEISEDKQKTFDAEAEKRKSDFIEEVHSTVSDSTQEATNNEGCCQPDGGCCCKATVEDESEAHVCTCGHPGASSGPKSPRPESRSTSGSSEKPSSPPIAPLKVLSGRPAPTNIIRKVLEEANGETAVVGCGPRGLRDDVRTSVVRLSDERAVHKGTGALGIYCHIEGFGY